MATATITRLPDPAGPVNDPSGLCYTGALAFDPSGRYLAQVLYGAGREQMMVCVYRRDGGQLTKITVLDWHPEQGDPSCCWWDRTGGWLVVSSVGAGPYGADDAQYRLWLYRRTGDTLTRAGDSGPAISGTYPYPGNVAFHDSGRWVALATGRGVWGLASFDAATGALALADGAVSTAGNSPMALAVAWHPTDHSLLSVVNAFGAVLFYRLDDDGGYLQGLDAGTMQLAVGANPAGAPTNTGAISWHPGGTSAYLDDQYGWGVFGVQQYTFPPLSEGQLPTDLGQLYGGYAVDPFSGLFLAGGPGSTSGGYGGCGGGGAQGLSIETLTADGAPAGRLNLDQSAEQNTAFGDFVAWAPGDAAGTSYLAASVSNWSFSYPFGAEPWGVRLYEIGHGRDAPAVSQLFARRPDGTFAAVGLAGQPLQLRLPDGTWRAWPGSTFPLYQRMNDGTWVKVLG